MFQHVAIEDIQSVYPTIEPFLKELSDKTGADWIPADVYMLLKNGACELWLTTDGEQIAFLVLEERNDLFSGSQELFVWVGYSTFKQTLRAETVDFLMTEMSYRNCRNLTFCTVRPGFIRHLAKYGFEAKPIYQVSKKNGTT